MKTRRNAAMKKPRAARRPGPGRPFQKGDDPRRNVHGQRNAEAVAEAKRIRDHLVTEGEREISVEVAGQIVRAKRAEVLAKVIWQNALGGNLAFIQTLLERVEGKVPQGVDFGPPGGSIGPLKIEVVHVQGARVDGDGDNGDGQGGGNGTEKE